MIDVLHFNASAHGGAALAVDRIHQAVAATGIASTVEIPTATHDQWAGRLRRIAGRQFSRLQRTDNSIRHSPAFFPSPWAKRLNQSSAKLIHLHWVGNEALSVKQIGALKRPVIWTLHDMWAFCGAEHVSYDNRWREGYLANNRPAAEGGFDLNRWVWSRKQRHWHTPLQIVAPSRWMAQCVAQSALMKDWPVTTIPNPINTDLWQPMPKQQAREQLGLPEGEQLILFGTFGETFAWHKGFDLLVEALEQLKEQRQRVKLLVLGQEAPKSHTHTLPFAAHFCGHINDQTRLRLHYCAADLLVIPSRIDNLPNTGVEALACGTPIVAFNIGGLPDIVEHGKTGYLADAFDTRDLAKGLRTVLDLQDSAGWAAAARHKALAQFSMQTVGARYQAVYNDWLR